MPKIRSKLTYANVISTLCLFILLGGSAYAAATITGKRIKNGSITGKDVKNKSLTKRDFKGSFAGPRGRAGARGAQGARGARGAAGPQGPAGATRVTVRQGSEVLGTSTAVCAAGERAVGGGGSTGDAAGYLYNSTPAQTSGTPTAWNVSARSADSPGDPVTVRAYAVCAAP